MPRAKACTLFLILITQVFFLEACHKKIATIQQEPSRAAFIVDENFSVTDSVQKLMELSGVKPARKLSEVVSLTQPVWLRARQSERMHLVEEYENLRPTLLMHFRNLGLITEVTANKTHYDYVLLLGANYLTMENRVAYLEKILASGVTIKHLALLGSHRPLEHVHEVEVMLKKHQFAVVPTTEIEMMEALINASPMKDKLHNINIIRIASPMKINSDGTVARANTRDTVEDLLKLDVTAGSSLVISSQPYILRQDLIVRSLLPSPWTIETVGDSAPIDLPSGVYFDELARVLYEIRQFHKVF